MANHVSDTRLKEEESDSSNNDKEDCNILFAGTVTHINFLDNDDCNNGDETIIFYTNKYKDTEELNQEDSEED